TWSTNVLASLSKCPIAHPSRSNPAMRSSFDGPFACTTPSTEICVVVVSFMIAAPFALGRPSQAPLTPATNTSAPIRHRLRDFFRDFLVAGGKRSGPSKRSLGHLRRPQPRPGGFRRVAPHPGLPVAGLRPLGGKLERHAGAGGLDDPQAGEVLLASNAGGVLATRLGPAGRQVRHLRHGVRPDGDP